MPAIGDLHAELRGIPDRQNPRRGGAEGFGGYAAAVEAGASELVAFYEGHALSLMGGEGGGLVAAGTRADNY